MPNPYVVAALNSPALHHGTAWTELCYWIRRWADDTLESSPAPDRP